MMTVLIRNLTSRSGKSKQWGRKWTELLILTEWNILAQLKMDLDPLWLSSPWRAVPDEKLGTELLTSTAWSPQTDVLGNPQDMVESALDVLN
jgi:hypothetical protein